MLMWGRLYASHGGGWYNTSVFLRLMVRLKYLAASEKQLTMCWRASLYGWEGRSHQQTAAQWWVPRWFSCVQGGAERWIGCCLFGNGCRCHLAGTLLPHRAWCWRRLSTMWGPECIPAWRRWRSGSCLTHCASPDLADLHGADGRWWEILGNSQDAPGFSTVHLADSIKGLGRVYESSI